MTFFELFYLFQGLLQRGSALGYALLQPGVGFLQFHLKPPKRQVCRDAGQDLFVLKRLDHVIDRADLEAAHLVGRIREGGHKDDRDCSRVCLGFEAAARLEPIEAGHHHVEQDEVGSGVLHLFERAQAVAGHQHFEPLLMQVIEQYTDVGRRVVDDQNRPFFRRLGAHGLWGLLGF